MPPYRPAPSDDEIERAAAKLRAAKQIVIVAGTGAAAVRRGKGAAGAGRGAGGADRHLAGRARDHPDAASPVDWLRGQLCRAARQPDRARGGPRAVRRLPHRRSGDAHLAHSGASIRRCVQIDIDPRGTRPHPIRNTLGLMGDPKATLAKLARCDRQGAARHARSAIGPPASWRPGGEERAPKLASNGPRRSCPTGCATRSPARCRRTESWSPTPDTPASGRQYADRTERRGPDLSACRRFARLVVPGVAWREMRGAATVR